MELAAAHTLVIIPARKGSSGLPGKNTRQLQGQPLIHYTWGLAKTLFPVENICVSSNDPDVLNLAEAGGLPFRIDRPDALAQADTGMYEVLVHALSMTDIRKFDFVLLLQACSPFRTQEHIRESFRLLDKNANAVFSVEKSKALPGFNLLTRDSNGYLNTPGESAPTRQLVPEYLALNGSIYWFRSSALLSAQGILNIPGIVPYIMPAKYSVDIDTEEDWEIAEIFSRQNLLPNV